MALFLRILAFVALTVLTQIGGVAYLLAMVFSKGFNVQRRGSGFLIFLTSYAMMSFATLYIAPAFGRVPLPCFAGTDALFMVRSPLYCMLNRQYVVPDMRDLASALSKHVNNSFPGTTTLALDANFPFLNGFPLFPHLSHTDGRKLDIAFYYQDPDRAYIDRRTKSPVGYFAFEQPGPGAKLPCDGRNDWLTLRWNMDFLQRHFPTYMLEQKRTKEALAWLSTDGVNLGVEKLFVEPHLAQALGVQNEVIRFQGCRAARHDDHIHIQLTDRI
jgi:hypothetical protein